MAEPSPLNGVPSAYWPFTLTLKVSPASAVTVITPRTSPLVSMWPLKLHCPGKASALGLAFCQSAQAWLSSGKRLARSGTISFRASSSQSRSRDWAWYSRDGHWPRWKLTRCSHSLAGRRCRATRAPEWQRPHIWLRLSSNFSTVFSRRSMA
ncbi:hypothetical protein D9M68_629760 [compost metagenome]